ncbi:MAG: dTMP kinase [Desulfamplus sp.]|nr:dTMP kinase [Desulfamplus sp.]MBF0413485.1 dTMP kinase [Desulfamplus sp.]
MFVTLEGIEGSGKTTQIEAIAQFLRSNGNDVVTTREPGATSTGKKIRSILLDPDNISISPLCELMLYGADRAQHISEVILPALKAGKTVLCDRFADATAAYQGFGRGLDTQLINDIYKIVAGKLKPDLTILFDLDPLTGLERTFKALRHGERHQNESRFEQEHLDFHKRVRNGYLAIAHKEKERFFIVDASISKEEIFEKIILEVSKRKDQNKL